MSIEIEKLIEKYFNGTTSSEEEKIVRDYFLSKEENEENRVYKLLFDHYEREKQEKSPTPADHFWDTHQDRKEQKKRYRKWIALVAGVAASLFLILAIITGQQSQEEYILIVHGNRVDDPELVARYIEEHERKMEKALKAELSPLEKAEDVERRIEAIGTEMERIHQKTEEKIKEAEKKINQSIINNNYNKKLSL